MTRTAKEIEQARHERWVRQQEAAARQGREWEEDQASLQKQDKLWVEK